MSSAPYTYLFSYQSHSNFATLLLSDSIKAPLFTNQLGSEYQHKYITELNDIFNCLYGLFTQSHDVRDPQVFITRLKMLLLANIWSDPHILFSVCSFAMPHGIDIEVSITTRGAFAAWYEWLGSGKLVKDSKLKTQMSQFVSNQRSSVGTPNPGSLSRLNELKATVKTRALPIQVTTPLLEDPDLKKLHKMFLTYAQDVLDASGLENAVYDLFTDAGNKYGWYFARDSKKINNLNDRLIADVLIRRTYQYDAYKTTPKRDAVISPEKLESRYIDAAQLLGVPSRGKILRNRHNLDYVSMWNRISYLVNLFEFGIDKKNFSTKINRNRASADEIASLYLLLALCGCIPPEWVEHVSKTLDQVDSIALDEDNASSKLEYAWIAILGVLQLSMVNPAMTNAGMNRSEYENLQHIIEILSRWGWQTWFCDSIPFTKTFVKSLWASRVGADIQYVPVQRFSSVFPIYLEDVYNERPKGVETILKRFNSVYNEHDLGDSIVTILNRIVNRKKGLPYEFKTIGESSTEVARNSMTALYAHVQTLHHLLSDGIRLISRELAEPLQSTTLTPQIATVMRLCTTIHLSPAQTEGGAYLDRALEEFIFDTDKLVQELANVNRITPQIPLREIPKSTMKYTSDRLHDTISDILSRSKFTQQLGLPDLGATLQSIKKNWENSIGSYSPADFSDCYTTLSYFLVVIKSECDLIEHHWNLFYQNVSLTIGIGRNTSRLEKTLQPLNRDIHTMLHYLQNLEVLPAKYAQTREYKDSLGHTDTLVEMLPYLRVKK